MRNYGIQSNRAGLGGLSTDAAATRNAILPRDSIQLAGDRSGPSAFCSLARNVPTIVPLTRSLGTRGKKDQASNLLSSRSPLKLLQVLQALRDVFMLLVWIVFGLLISFAVGGPFIALGWILFFS